MAKLSKKAQAAANKKRAATLAAKRLADERAHKKRSLAAKRGWQTRKLRTLPKQIRNNKKRIAAVSRKQPKPAKKIPRETAKHRLSRLEAENASLRDRIAIAEEKAMLDGWPKWMEPGKVRRDGTIGLFRSRLRDLPEADALHTVLQREVIKGAVSFRRFAIFISKKYLCPLREVYTLLESP